METEIMKNNLLLILQSCDTVRELQKQFKKPFGWLRFKEKKEYEILKKELEKQIDNLVNDVWDIRYLTGLEYTIISYYSKLQEYLYHFYIRDYNNPNKMNQFKPICITDDEYRVYTIESNGLNLSYTIFDIRTGEHLKIVSGNTTSEAQKKIELTCKKVLIKIIKNYMNDIKIIE